MSLRASPICFLLLSPHLVTQLQQVYRNLFIPQTPTVTHAEALRAAQLQMWKAGIHPHYWSAFILQGEWRN